MWRPTLIAGATAAVVLAGTAFAVASPNTDQPAELATQAPADHWSEMREIVGDDWGAMVDQMEQIADGYSSTMATMMKGLDMEGLDMEGFDMGSGMGGFDMEGLDMEGFDMGAGVGGFDMEGFDKGSGMGGFDIDR